MYNFPLQFFFQTKSLSLPICSLRIFVFPVTEFSEKVFNFAKHAVVYLYLESVNSGAIA